jgi:hypothetical protein
MAANINMSNIVITVTVHIAGRLGSFYIGGRAIFLVVCPQCPGIQKLRKRMNIYLKLIS